MTQRRVRFNQIIRRKKAYLRKNKGAVIVSLLLAFYAMLLINHMAIKPVNHIQKTKVQTVHPPVVKRHEDLRIAKLRKFLADNNSPLASYAPVIVREADKNAIPYTYIASISGMESNFGNQTMPGSHNAWGIGGDNFFYFDSWEEGITYASQLLGKDYQSNMISGIKEKYCPASDNCNPDWANVVTGYSFSIAETKI